VCPSSYIIGLISTDDKVPLASIGRFVLTNSLPDGDSGWNIYLTSGPTHFQALALGQDLVKVAPNGTN
jgi:hypothetical protein